ncbi:MAG: hypothetical protein ACI8SC_003024 [Colwellia sp.]|jgi:hypothetical protein
MGFTFDGKRVFNKRLNRVQLYEFLLKHELCHIVMEACYSSHYWGRTFLEMGHTVALIPAQHVTLFVRGNKNDSNDTLAIFEASNRVYIRHVPIKTEAQQEILMLHSLRERLVRNRTAASNQLRGLLTDFGIIFPLGAKAFDDKMKALHKVGHPYFISYRDENLAILQYGCLLYSLVRKEEVIILSCDCLSMSIVHPLVDLSRLTANFKIFNLADVDGIGFETHYMTKKAKIQL